ncbi:MAG TPA: alpha/beta hydrolase [Candidatus Limnocylindria bacterium]
MTLTQTTTRTLDVPGATLAYDVRPGSGGTNEPPLMLIGSPMGAAGFQTLAGFFPERTVITYDPRGADRSTRTDGAGRNEVAEHADDVHRIIQAAGLGPVDLFASSGGAVNALALIAAHPEDVRTLVAHEPPDAAILPDAEAALAACRDIHDTYMRAGFGAGMAKFIGLTSHTGEIPADWVDRPTPDPAAFGLPSEDDGGRSDPLMGLNMPATLEYVPDFDALRAAPTRIVVAAGEESAGQMAHRGAYAVAERLGQEVVVFPSHHGGFLGGEHGWAGQPEAFAAKLRDVLAA